MIDRTASEAPRDRSGRRSVAAGATLTLLSFGVFAAPSAALMSSSGLEAQRGAVQQEDFRTEVPQLGGYSAEAISSPMSMLLFEPTIPVPAGPGEPHGEMHGSYSKATLGTGPASRGLGSSTWPGPTAGDGLSAFDENIPPYPFKASATFPDGPFDATQGSEGGEFGMYAFAHGIDVLGRSDGGGELYPGFVSVGNVSTVSTTTVVDGAVVAETIAAVSDLSILDGLITMDGTQTRLVATSNGETAIVDGVFEVSGLQIMGVEYEMTQDGVVVRAPDGAPAPPILIPIDARTSIDLQDAIGIKVETAPMIESVEGAKGRISTRGMQITIDTSPFRQAAGFIPLADIIGSIPDPGVGVPICDELPPEMSAIPCFNNPVSGLKANLFTLAALQPETQFLFGGGQASASASLPFSFTPPPLPNISAPAPLPPSSTTTTTTTTSFPQPSFVSPPVQAAVPEQSPVVAPPVSGSNPPQLVALAIPAGLSRGIDAGAMVVGMAGIGLLARGGRRLTMSAIYGTGAPVSVGAASVPDLRAFARGEQI